MVRPHRKWARWLPKLGPELSCVNLGKSHQLSEPQSLICEMGWQRPPCTRGGRTRGNDGCSAPSLHAAGAQ